VVTGALPPPEPALPLVWVTTGVEAEPGEADGAEAAPLVAVVTGAEAEDEDEGAAPLEEAPVATLPPPPLPLPLELP